MTTDGFPVIELTPDHLLKFRLNPAYIFSMLETYALQYDVLVCFKLFFIIYKDLRGFERLDLN